MSPSLTWSSILILSSNLRLDLPNGLFPSGYPTKTLYAPLFSPIHVTCPAHLIFLDLITRKIFGEYRSLSSSLCSFLHSLVLSSLLGPNILFSTLFSYIPSLRSSLNVSDQVSHPYKTTGKTIVVYLSLHFCLVNCRTKYSAPNDNKKTATQKHNLQGKYEVIFAVGEALGCIFQLFRPYIEGCSILLR